MSSIFPFAIAISNEGAANSPMPVRMVEPSTLPRGHDALRTNAAAAEIPANSARGIACRTTEDELPLGVEPGSRSERREAAAQSRQRSSNARNGAVFVFNPGRIASFLSSIRTQWRVSGRTWLGTGADLPLSYNGDWAEAEFFK
jgi:hypothetical protein